MAASGGRHSVARLHAESLDAAQQREQSKNMNTPIAPLSLPALRQQIDRLARPRGLPGQASQDGAAGTLPFGLAPLDHHLPGGGLARAALHDISGGGCDAQHAASAAGFAAGILGRLDGPVMWCRQRDDLYPPGLAACGLSPQAVLHLRVPNDQAALLAMEEALRARSLRAVLAEVTQCSMLASRRLSLAAEQTGTMALLLFRRPRVQRRRPRPGGAAPPAPAWEAEGSAAAEIARLGAQGPPQSCAVSSWCVTPRPAGLIAGSSPDAFRPLWEITLLRCRGGMPARWLVEGCDVSGRLALPALLADRPAASPAQHAA